MGSNLRVHYLNFSNQEPNSKMGTPLLIELPKALADVFSIGTQYSEGTMIGLCSSVGYGTSNPCAAVINRDCLIRLCIYCFSCYILVRCLFNIFLAMDHFSLESPNVLI